MKKREEIIESIQQGKSICQALDCQYAGYDQKGKYGCQKYLTPKGCLINQVKNTQHNQYFIYAEDKGKLSLIQISLMELALKSINGNTVD
jgi:hypothetical protein